MLCTSRPSSRPFLRALERLPNVVPPLQPATGIAVANEAFFPLVDPQICDFVAPHRPIRADRRTPHHTRQRLLPDFFVNMYMPMCFNYQVAIWLDVDNVSRDAERQRIFQIHRRIDAKLAVERSRDFRFTAVE